jgi:hypothetical protein
MMTWILTNSLWLVGLGLMLASSGIDGAYMARWMPAGFAWLGYVLNTTADVSGMVLTYFFGRFQQDRAKGKRRLALFLLPADLVAALFSWFFSWRQLLIVLPTVEPLAYQWVAPIAAAFIPALLIFIGYAESLLAGRFETAQISQPATQPKTVAAQDKAQIAAPTNGGNGHHKHVCVYCGADFDKPQSLSAHLRYCKAYQAQRAATLAG